MVKTSEDIRLLNEKISHAAVFVTRINDELSKVIVGQQAYEQTFDHAVLTYNYLT